MRRNFQLHVPRGNSTSEGSSKPREKSNLEQERPGFSGPRYVSSCSDCMDYFVITL